MAFSVGRVRFYQHGLRGIGLLYDGGWRRRGGRVGGYVRGGYGRSGHRLSAGVNYVHNSDAAGLGLPIHVEDGAFTDIDIAASAGFAGMAVGQETTPSIV